MASHGASEKEEKFGQEHSLIHEAVITGRKVGAGKEFWSRLAHDEDFFMMLVTLEKKKDLSTHRNLRALIKAGKYDWVHPDIMTKNFPLESDDVVDLDRLEVVHLNEELTTEQAKEKLNGRGYRPAKIRGLLTYGAKNPEEQSRYPIVALASDVVFTHGSRMVPYLHGEPGQRLLDLLSANPSSLWADDYRFLAVRK